MGGDKGGGNKEKKLLHQGQNIFMVATISFLYNVLLWKQRVISRPKVERSQPKYWLTSAPFENIMAMFIRFDRRRYSC